MNWGEPHGGISTLLLSDFIIGTFLEQNVVSCLDIVWLSCSYAMDTFYRKETGNRFSGQLNWLLVRGFLPRGLCLGSESFNSINAVFSLITRVAWCCVLAHFTNKEYENFVLWHIAGPALATCGCIYTISVYVQDLVEVWVRCTYLKAVRLFWDWSPRHITLVPLDHSL